MTELKGLSGWRTREDPRKNGDWEVIIPDDDLCPWYVATVHQCVVDVEAEQVARLIAAAPDLLKATKSLAAQRARVIQIIEDHHAGKLSLAQFEHEVTGELTGSAEIEDAERADAAIARALGSEGA